MANPPTPTAAQVAQALDVACGYTDRTLAFPEVLSIIAAALATAHAEGRQAALEEAAGIADEWAYSKSCQQHEDDPCCHVRTGAAIAAKLRARATEAQP